MNAILQYAKCIQERSDAANTPVVRYIWNMWPFNTNPFISYLLDLCACPFCWWFYPFDQLFIVCPWNNAVANCLICITLPIAIMPIGLIWIIFIPIWFFLFAF